MLVPLATIYLAGKRSVAKGWTGGTPASTPPADYPRLSTRISYPTSCTSQR